MLSLTFAIRDNLCVFYRVKVLLRFLAVDHLSILHVEFEVLCFLMVTQQKRFETFLELQRKWWRFTQNSQMM